MKKIILSMLLVMAVTTTFAQKANVSKAKNKALMENPDFTGARELIKLALADPSTKDLSSTWNIAGLIGYKENEVLSNKLLLGQKIDNDVKGKAILESYDYYIKAYELDGLPDAKGRIKAKLQKDIKSKIKEYYVQNQNLIAYGAHLFENKKYDETIKVFDIYLGIPKLPMMADEIKLDSNYYMIKYYNAIAATNAEKSEKAIKLYTELTNEGYQELQVHQLLYEEYYKLKDTANYVKVLKAGFEKFPKEAWFLQNLINYYIFTNQSKEALTYLNNAIESEPGIAQYYYVKGNLTESMGMIEEAQAAFDKSLELDPKSADSYAGIGRLKYNQAVKMSDKANEIKDNRLYNAAKDKADLVFKESIPFFKKAVELNPKEMEYKRTLKTLYYRLQMDKEFEALQKEMGE